MEALLKVNDISMVFGGLRAVSNFSMEIKAGELIGLIGPNGAGKTTAFNMIAGVYTPTEGEIMFNGTRTSGKKSYQVTQLGMARTFQNIRLFSELSVIDNVKIAYNMHVKYTLGEAIARIGRYFSEEDEITKKALELLKIFKLEDKAYETAKNLPYGEQRRLEIARALATEPKLLLLDEPAAGMNPQETKELMEMIRWIRDKFSLSILLITPDGPFTWALPSVRKSAASIGVPSRYMVSSVTLTPEISASTGKELPTHLSQVSVMVCLVVSLISQPSGRLLAFTATVYLSGLTTSAVSAVRMMSLPVSRSTLERGP